MTTATTTLLLLLLILPLLLRLLQLVLHDYTATLLHYYTTTLLPYYPTTLLHPTPYTLHTTHYTLHPTHYTHYTQELKNIGFCLFLGLFGGAWRRAFSFFLYTFSSTITNKMNLHKVDPARFFSAYGYGTDSAARTRTERCTPGT